MSDTPATTHAEADDQSLAHPVPLGVLFATFGWLMVLTIFTVMATWVDLGMLQHLAGACSSLRSKARWSQCISCT